MKCRDHWYTGPKAALRPKKWKNAPGMSSTQAMTEAPAPKRVWFVTRKWPPAMGGMETYSVRLFEQLKRRCDAELVALPGQEDGSVPKPSELLRFGLRTAFRVTGVAFDAEVIHLGDMALWPIGWVARFRRSKIPVILSAHGTDVSYPARGGLKGRLYGAYLRAGARLLGDARVIANSAATADAARTFGFQDVRVVTLATDLTPVETAEPRRTILFSGRLVPRKGLRWFVENVLPKLPPDIGLEVAGTKWDPDEVKALEAQRVEYIGKLAQDDLRQAYATATCVVVPNIDVPDGEFEGFGLVAVEAAASGGVVLAAHHSGLKEAVKDGETGFSLPPGDAEVWISKITEVLSWSMEQRDAFIAGATSTAARVFSWDRVGQETVRAYDAEAD